MSCAICAQVRVGRIVLRICGHILCLNCAVSYIKSSIIEDGDVQVPCPSDQCQRLVHPNDVWVLLTHPKLEPYASGQERQGWLDIWQYNTVTTAMGGEIKTKRCPKCRDLYIRRAGCNWVRCAKRTCRTYFCWPCGRATEDIEHYVEVRDGACRLGWDDVYRSSFVLRFLSQTSGCCLWILQPCLIFPLFILLPLLALVMVTKALCRCTYQGLRKLRAPTVLAVVLVCVCAPFFLPLSVIVAFGPMLGFAFFIFGVWQLFYAPCTYCVPFMRAPKLVFKAVGCFFALFGLVGRGYAFILKQSEDAQRFKEQEMEEEQEDDRTRSHYTTNIGTQITYKPEKKGALISTR